MQPVHRRIPQKIGVTPNVHPGLICDTLSLAMELLDKITSKSARVGVIGLGYVGLPLPAAAITS
jgi:hypothetical protein